jgi:quinol monooxygenase YgiN
MSEPDRGEFIATLATVGLTSALTGCATTQQEAPMYGLIGRMKVAPGQRDVVIRFLLDGTGAMPGCLSYIVAEDPTDPDAIWVTEAWDSAESHTASLKLPAVQQAIAGARPHITGFGERFETVPVGGFGLG